MRGQRSRTLATIGLFVSLASVGLAGCTSPEKSRFLSQISGRIAAGPSESDTMAAAFELDESARPGAVTVANTDQ